MAREAASGRRAHTCVCLNAPRVAPPGRGAGCLRGCATFEVSVLVLCLRRASSPAGERVFTVGVDPEALARLERALVRTAGGYLRNTVREDGVTCRVCAFPCPGQTHCRGCAQRLDMVGRADQVGFLTYAMATTRAGSVIRQYKGEAAVKADTDVVAATVVAGLGRHGRCAGRVLSAPVTYWTVVPSLPAPTVGATTGSTRST